MAEKSRPAGLDPDTERMLRFKEGDLEAFEDLFTRHVRAVTNFAFRFVRRREIAEELAQEVFLRVNDSVSSYRPEAKFTTWLYRIATNVCLNEIRRPQYRAVHTSLDDNGSEHASGRPMELADPARVGPDRMLERDTVVRALRQALDGLPQNQRLAFILNKYQELSYVEVAAVMKVSEKAVKSLIHRAKEAMAERLRPQLPELL